ncbi:hypothetical protein ACLOJK_016016 [Asimina triloba]
MRVNMEVEMDADGNMSPAPENGPRRVHPRYTKTSACKDLQAMENIVEPSESKPPDQSCTATSKVTELQANASAAPEEVDTDECRLCSMDGTLLICDGCPSVYHSRCIGLNKASLPVGEWLCPECLVNKAGPTCSRIGTGLKGTEYFGIDPHERVFLGACNYLLVLGASVNEEPFTRYYNQIDVLKVLQVLHSSIQQAPFYSQISRGIMQYWDISGNLILPNLPGADHVIKLSDVKEDARDSFTICSRLVKENQIVSKVAGGSECQSNTNEFKLDNGSLSCQAKNYIETGVNGPSVGQAHLLDHQTEIVSNCKKMGEQPAHGQAETAQQVSQAGSESAITAGSLFAVSDPSVVNHPSSGERAAVLEFATTASRDVESSGREDSSSLVLQTKNVIPRVSHEIRPLSIGYGGINKGDILHGASYIRTSFKPQAYVNQYILGDVAASAAAMLARRESENSKLSESRSSSKARKLVSESSSFQVKVFAMATTHFVWPSSERKLLEVPREKCGWCIACKAPASSRKGCLLNAAASNALKGASRVFSVARSIKIGEGQLASIAAYILHMEESLRGLLVGSLMTESYRRNWRKLVEQASSCRLLKILLLEPIDVAVENHIMRRANSSVKKTAKLEENIHALALSGGWLKPVDDWSVDSSTAPTSVCMIAPAKKRGPNKKNRKQSATSEITADAPSKSPVNWWRGGKLSKMVFQKGILPRPVSKRAARQGGSKGISGINYNQGSEIPRRSRKLAWKAAVEMSRNASQLALQVRYLDVHVRWSDLVRPDQVSQDGKAPDAETFNFRNAVVHDKRVIEGKTRYLLDFGHQKHIPSRIQKIVLEVEHSQDGREKMWFSDSHIPLYLLKDYEEKAENFSMPSSNEQSWCFSKLRRRPLRTYYRDIFTYLEHRDDKSSCTLCRQDVLLRCHQVVSAAVENYKKLANAQLSLQGHNHIFSLTKSMQQQNYNHVAKNVQQDGYKQIAKNMQQDGFRHKPHVTGNEARLDMKPPTPDSGRKGRYGTCLTNGLIWKKKKPQTPDGGAEFRLKNILLQGTGNMDSSIQPVCVLCREPYNSELMYICCQSCSNWYHADAVQLKEERIFDLEGFRCCKCRRKSSPVCPYMKPDNRKSQRASKKQGTMIPSVPGVAVGKPELGERTSPVNQAKPENFVLEDNDPLLFSLQNVEPIVEEMPEVKPEWPAAAGLFLTSQKLTVRRNVKQEDEEPVQDANLVNPEHVSCTSADWNASDLANFEGGNMEGMEFEPQTYFSFTELLANGDDRVDGLFEASGDASGNWLNSSVYDNMGGVCQGMAPYNSFETYEVGMGTDYQDFSAAAKLPGDPVPCQMCKLLQPAPDLLCENCFLQIHSHCSPWDEPAIAGSVWRCGSCRDWR